MGDKGSIREDHWWERVFNEASSNVNVQKSKTGKIEVELHDKAGVEITNKSFSMKKLKEKNEILQYGSFLKSATLLANVGKEEEIEGHLTTNDIEIQPIKVLTDEELFKACNGRTAHKGARHGLNLRGKLDRIAEQERILLEKMKGKQNKHEVFREPYAKKSKKNPLAELNSSKEETSDDNVLPVDIDTDYMLKPSRKRKKRDKEQESALVSKIIGIGLDDSMNFEDPEKPTEQEVSEEPYNGTPTRKKKKAKKVFVALNSIQELEKSEADEEVPEKKKKKKKGKRKLDEDDETMTETKEKYLKEKPKVKAKRVKLNDSYEASDDGEDIVDKINAEQHKHHLKQSKKKSKKQKKRDKLAVKKTVATLDELL